jgi:hypothetical protein
LRRYRLYLMQTTDQYISVFRTTAALLEEYETRNPPKALLPNLPIHELMIQGDTIVDIT